MASGRLAMAARVVRRREAYHRAGELVRHAVRRAARLTAWRPAPMLRLLNERKGRKIVKHLNQRQAMLNRDLFCCVGTARLVL